MTQVSQSRLKGHIFRDFRWATGEMGSFSCWNWCCGTTNNREEAENGVVRGENRPRGGEMEKLHPGLHCYLWLSTVFYFLHHKSPS